MNANDPARDDRADRNLLFGVLALQMDFIRREDLIAATSAWVLDKARSLDQILLERQALTADEHAMLVALVAKHLAKHNDDPQQSLAAVSSVGSIREELRKLGDPQLEASLAAVALNVPAADPYATNVPSTCDWGGQGLRFRVLRPHAKGGLGEVFVAQDLELHREVALKEIQSRFADQPDSRSRFVLEAEITGGLEHPGIVPVYGLGQYADGRPFYAMRFIRGDSLAEAIARFHRADKPGRDPGERTLELRKLLGRFIDVCEAIEYAHSRGILHRDLKPGNIMLGKYGETLVVDWGLAKAVGRGERASDTGETTLQPSSGDSVDPTLMGKAVGTPAYMSPEQAAGRLNELGPASDVYSLGATLYCLLTGQPPFSGNDKGEILRRVEGGDFPLPREIKPQIPAALQAICLKAMSLKPTDRYVSPRILAGDIEHWLADEPVSCLVEPLAVLARRWMKRHRALVASSAAGFAVLVASLIGLLALVVVHNRTLDAKNHQLDQANADLKKANESERTAKLDADKKRIDAEKARDETKQVLDYLVQAFRKSDPDVDGEKLTVAALFDQAVEQLETTFPNQPLMQAELLTAIGGTYRGLGLYEKSITTIGRARELRRRELGDDHQDTLASMNWLGLAYKDAARLEEAIALHEQTLKVRRAKLGPEHRDTLDSMNNLAMSYAAAGRLPAAIALQKETLELQKKNLGQNDTATLTSMHNLALAYSSAGNFSDAVTLLEQTLELKQAVRGADHTDTLLSMEQLASVYGHAGRLPEALALFDRALELHKAKLGPDHPGTLLLMNNFAVAYYQAGKFDQALPLMEQTLELVKNKLGPEHSRTLAAMNNLAGAYQATDRFSEALPLFEQSLEATRAKLGPDHPDTLVMMNNLATAYYQANKMDKALPLFEQSVKLQKATLGPDHPSTLASMNNLAVLYQSAGRMAQAVEIFEETLPVMKGKLGIDHPDTLSTMTTLAGTYILADRLPDAILLYKATLELSKPKLGPEDDIIVRAMAGLGKAHLLSREFSAAENHVRAALAIRMKKSPDDWLLFDTKSLLGGALGGQKKYTEAEPLLVEGYQGMKEREAKLPPFGKTRLNDAIQRLIDLYTAWEKPEEAAKWKAVLDEHKAAL